ETRGGDSQRCRAATFGTRPADHYAGSAAARETRRRALPERRPPRRPLATLRPQANGATRAGRCPQAAATLRSPWAEAGIVQANSRASNPWRERQAIPHRSGQDYRCKLCGYGEKKARPWVSKSLSHCGLNRAAIGNARKKISRATVARPRERVLSRASLS